MSAADQVLQPYPVEIDFPDFSGYADGNTGIPYLYSFDSGQPGEHAMINAITHGNEVCGAVIVKELLDAGIRPRAGRLTLSFANVDAYRNFDEDDPDASRFVDQDLNRVWTRQVLDDTAKDSCELRRARAMRPLIDTVDLLLDIHSMHERSEPLVLSGPLEKGIELARTIGSPRNIIVDEGHVEGRRLRDYGKFGDSECTENALLIECGQHWEAKAISVARDSASRFLIAAGVLEESDLPAGWLQPSQGPSRVIEVSDAVVATSMDFRFEGPYTGLETFADAGTVIGWNNGEAVVTPYPNCVLVMPSIRQLRPGVTVVRFGREVNDN